MTDAQIIPDNAGTEENDNRRKVVKKTTAPEKPSIKNPQPVKVELRDKDSRQFGLDEANELISKFKKQFSIAPIEVPSLNGGIQQLTKYIKKLDPDNTSGAVKPALDILDKLLKEGTGNPMASIPSILGKLQGLLQQALNQINNNNKKKNQPEPVPLCPPGQKWDEEKQACIVDPKVTESDFLSDWN